MEQLKFHGLICCLIILLNIQLSLGFFDSFLTRIVMIDKDDTSFMDATKLRVTKIKRSQHAMSGLLDFLLHNQHYLTLFYNQGIITFKVDVGNQYTVRKVI